MAQLDLLLGKPFAFPDWCTGYEEERVACGKELSSHVLEISAVAYRTGISETWAAGG
jgi:hypothetical protein